MEIGVPWTFDDKAAVDSVVRRLATSLNLDAKSLMLELTLEEVDLSRFSADVDLDYSTGFPGASLRVVSSLFKGSGRIYRAGARATHQKAPSINNGYTDADEELYSQVIAGMTEKGSYSLPIYVKVGRPDTKGMSGLAAPSPERLLTQKVAESLQAIDTHIIRPEKLRTDVESINELVRLGVSKDLVLAVVDLISVENTDAKTKFFWARSHDTVPTSKKLPTEIEFPHQAKQLLEEAAKHFTAPEPVKRAFNGRIDGVLLDEGEGTLTVIVAVPRGKATDDPNSELNARVDVNVWVDGDSEMDRIYSLMRNRKRVTFTGTPEKIGSRRIIKDASYLEEIPTQTKM